MPSVSQLRRALLTSTIVTSTLMVALVAPVQATGTPVEVRSNGFDRATVHRSYWNEFTQGVSSPNWNGDVAGCNPGSISVPYQQDQVDRVNWYRSLAGLDHPVSLDTTASQTAQAAALMIGARGAVSHTATPDWACYTATGADGLRYSNIYTRTGLGAIDGYMVDYGSSNASVGHRNWILLPQQRSVGIGEVPGSGSQNLGGHAMYVFSGIDFGHNAEQDVVVWPPSGQVPEEVVPPRWSLSIDNADFTGASVAVRRNGVPIDAPVIHRGSNANTYPNPVLVFELSEGALPADTADTVYDVTVTGVNSRAGSSFHWTTTTFDGDVAPGTIGSSSTPNPANATAGGSRTIVRSLFVDLLRREPQPTELDRWSSVVAAHGTGVMTEQLVGSDQWVGSVVEKMYQDTLGRSGDAAGMAFWVGLIQNRKAPVRDVAAAFYGSAEYRAGFGSDEAWVADLYRSLLGVEGDPAGIRYWADSSSGQRYGDVARDLYQSEPSRLRRVDALYQQLLGRAPDAAGRTYWSGILAGEDDIRLALNLVNSAEYQIRKS